jgi:hypothetical protein
MEGQRGFGLNIVFRLPIRSFQAIDFVAPIISPLDDSNWVAVESIPGALPIDDRSRQPKKRSIVGTLVKKLFFHGPGNIAQELGEDLDEQSNPSSNRSNVELPSPATNPTIQ